jgi:tetratricopeptide (TPR) repeat protein
MSKYLNHLLSAWKHGKGSKYTRNKDYNAALKYFQAALKYAMNADKQELIALETECIARTYLLLGDYINAKKSAVESLNLYNTLDICPVFANCIKRVNELLELLDKGKDSGVRS